MSTSFIYLFYPLIFLVLNCIGGILTPLSFTPPLSILQTYSDKSHNMETKHSHTPTSLTQGPMQQSSFQQEPSNSHPPPSQSSQTYTQAPSGTGASAQSATVTTENMDPIAYEEAAAHQLVSFCFSFLVSLSQR
jgi:hypothetical protein